MFLPLRMSRYHSKTSLGSELQDGPAASAARSNRRLRVRLGIALVLVAILVVATIPFLIPNDDQVVVPRIIALSQSSAIRQLQSVDLRAKVDVVYVHAETETPVPLHSVFSQEPTAGMSIAKGSVVRISVFGGGSTVPIATGYTLAFAEHELTIWGFRYRVEHATPLTTGGTFVSSQSPPPLAKRPPGTVVSLTPFATPFQRVLAGFANTLWQAGPVFSFGAPVALNKAAGEDLCANISVATVEWSVYCDQSDQFPAVSYDNGHQWRVVGAPFWGLLPTSATNPSSEKAHATACTQNVVALNNAVNAYTTFDGGHTWFTVGPGTWTITNIGCQASGDGSSYQFIMHVQDTSPGNLGTAVYATSNGRIWARVSQHLT